MARLRRYNRSRLVFSRFGCVAEERLPYSVPRFQGPREAYKAVSVVLHHFRGIRRLQLLCGAHFGPRTCEWREVSFASVHFLRQCRFGIIAPYKAQVRTIQESLKQARLSDILVGSVEQFQGQVCVDRMFQEGQC
jgi:hypothetical protein